MQQIIKFFNSLNIDFDELQGENPIKLLMKLTEIKNCYERNEIIDKIDFFDTRKFIPNHIYKDVHEDNLKFLSEKQVF